MAGEKSVIFDKKSIFDDRFATLYSMRIFSPVQHLLGVGSGVHGGASRQECLSPLLLLHSPGIMALFFC